MTSPEQPVPAAPARTSAADSPKVESFLDWFRINSRVVTAAAALVVVAAFGFWFYNRSAVLKTQNADRGLLAAKQSIGTGNVALAQTDLRKVADKYPGTSAGAEAAMLLGRLKLEQDDAKGAVEVLTQLSPRNADGPYAASILALLGDAYAQLGKPAEAAAQYDRASKATTMPNERALLMAKIGRTYQAAGDHAKAREVWEQLAKQQESPGLAAEARIRLGELLATPAKA